MVSEALGSASALVEFHIAGNLIQELPRSIGDLKNLEILDAKRNKLNYLPNELSTLPKLLKLDLEENTLIKIESKIFINLRNLTHLNLSKNKISDVESDAFDQMT